MSEFIYLFLMQKAKKNNSFHYIYKILIKCLNYILNYIRMIYAYMTIFISVENNI